LIEPVDPRVPHLDPQRFSARERDRALPDRFELMDPIPRKQSVLVRRWEGYPERDA